MDLFWYIALSIVYIMFTRFGLLISKWFNHVMFVVYFIIGGVIGWYMDSYITGYCLAIALSLILGDDIAS